MSWLKSIRRFVSEMRVASWMLRKADLHAARVRKLCGSLSRPDQTQRDPQRI